MTKTMIAAVLAASMLVLNGAYAAPLNKSRWRPHVSDVGAIAARQARAEARDLTSHWPTVSTSNRDSWEDRSVFYQGPTYVGRY